MQNSGQVVRNGLISMPLMDGQTMSSMEVAGLVGLRHDNVKRTISSLIEKGVIQDTQVEILERINGLGLTVKAEHYLIGKRDSYVVVAQLSPEFTGKLVDRWQELEDNRFQIPQTLPDALRLAADLSEKNSILSEKIKADAPKVELATLICEASNARCVRVWVKTMKDENNLKVGERKVFDWLVKKGHIFKNGGGYLPYAKSESNGNGYFTVVVTGDTKKAIRRQLMITGKGVLALTAKVIADLGVLDGGE